MTKSAKKIEIDYEDEEFKDQFEPIRPLWVSNLIFAVGSTIGIGFIIYFSLPIPN